MAEKGIECEALETIQDDLRDELKEMRRVCDGVEFEEKVDHSVLDAFSPINF